MPKYITYRSKNNNLRKITVINGQPYYQSTGQNSGLPEIWLPFLMVVGKRQIQIQDSLRSQYKCTEIKNVFDKVPSGYIVKFEDSFRYSPNQFPQIADSRLPTSETLITSLQLGSVINNVQSVLFGDDYKLSQKRINLIKGDEISDPDEINDWLIQQGASFVKIVLTDEPRISPELVRQQQDLEKSNNSLFSITSNWPQQLNKEYIRTYSLITLQINRIKSTSYDHTDLKFHKIIALLELQASILAEMKHPEVEHSSQKSMDNIISDWKNSSLSDDNKISNYALISKPRRTGFWGFFNIGRPDSQVFIDKLSEEFGQKPTSCFG